MTHRRRSDRDELRSLPFREAYRRATRSSPGSWNSVTTGLASAGTLWLVYAWLVLSSGAYPFLLGLALLPAGFVLTVRAWVYSRPWLMLAGVGVLILGALAPWWVWNAL